MTRGEKDDLLRDYAAGKVTWKALRERGFEDYVQVLGGLGELGLRPPIAVGGAGARPVDRSRSPESADTLTAPFSLIVTDTSRKPARSTPPPRSA